MKRTDPRIRNAVDRMIHEVIARCAEQESRPDSSKVLRAFLARVAGSYDSVCALVDTTSSQEQLDPRLNDCAVILRCMYDAYVQAAYIATAGDEKESLARLYLDFEHVERYLLAKDITQQKNKMAQIVAKSPMRATGEPRVIAEFDRVKSAYRTGNKNPNAVRKRWYAETLPALAKAIDRKDEYAWLVNRFHSSVHSGPFALFVGPGLTAPNSIVRIALLPVARLAGLVVDNDSLDVSTNTRGVIASCNKNMWDA